MENRPLLVLNRNYVLVTRMGHVVAFEKGVPTHVPYAVYQEAIGIGALPADGSDPNVLNDDKRNTTPSDPSERNPLIMKAIKTIVEKNERKDFTAAGSPSVKAVERELGFDVDGREVSAVWQAFHDEKAAK